MTDYDRSTTPFYTFYEKTDSLHLIKKLLAPCINERVKTKLYFRTVYRLCSKEYFGRVQRAVRVDGAARALFHLPSVVWASSRSNLIFVETRVRKPPTYVSACSSLHPFTPVNL